MKKLVFILIAMCAMFKANAQIKAYTADGVMARASSPDTVYIINFWATWCAPCVQELPEFNKLKSTYYQKHLPDAAKTIQYSHQYRNKLCNYLEVSDE